MELKRGAKIHLMGICGTGMAGLAGLLKSKGFVVSGSDQNMYPPMSEYIKALGIPVMEGYRPKNLQHHPDLVIVGNVITKENPEAQELLTLGLPYISFPQAIREFALKDKESIVISGTHGKTTTTSLIAWILFCAGLNPGYLVGGIPLNFNRNFNVGTGKYFVIEGDEYDTAFFDKRPKFLHYMPSIAVITSVEFDHADIYKDYSHVLESFKALLSIIPKEGSLILNGDISDLVAEVSLYGYKKFTYGLGLQDNYSLLDHSINGDHTCFRLRIEGKEFTFRTRLYGLHNLLNAVAAIAVGMNIGISTDDIYRAVNSFLGVKRRQEVIGVVDNITVIDDFAHHPTAVRETISAVKSKYVPKRLIAVFEPRSNSSRRNVFQEIYPLSFEHAETILVPEPKNMEKIPPDLRFSSVRLVEDLKEMGKDAFYFKDTSELMDFLLNYVTQGDLVLFMSNGDFDNLPRKIFYKLVLTRL